MSRVILAFLFSILCSFELEAQSYVTPQAKALAQKLKSLRNTDPAASKLERWSSLLDSYNSAVRSQKNHEALAELLYYRGILLEELGNRRDFEADRQAALNDFIRVSRDFSKTKLSDDALFKAIRMLPGSQQDELIAEFLYRFPESPFRYVLQEEKKSTRRKVFIESSTLPLIVLDPGHGGDDFGANNKLGLKEKDIALSLAKGVRRLLQRSGCCRVILTREGDSFLPLFDRTAVANNNGAALFVSIHSNSVSGPSRAHGFEIYSVSRNASNEALQLAQRENRSVTQSKGLVNDFLYDLYQRGAEAISDPFANYLVREIDRALPAEYLGVPIKNRGVKKGPFFVLFGAEMPAVLLELFFLSSEEDSFLLSQPAFRNKLERAIASSLQGYLSRKGEEG